MGGVLSLWRPLHSHLLPGRSVQCDSGGRGTGAAGAGRAPGAGCSRSEPSGAAERGGGGATPGRGCVGGGGRRPRRPRHRFPPQESAGRSRRSVPAGRNPREYPSTLSKRIREILSKGGQIGREIVGISPPPRKKKNGWSHLPLFQQGQLGVSVYFRTSFSCFHRQRTSFWPGLCWTRKYKPLTSQARGGTSAWAKKANITAPRL